MGAGASFLFNDMRERRNSELQRGIPLMGRLITNLCVCAERGRGTRQHTTRFGDFNRTRSFQPLPERRQDGSSVFLCPLRKNRRTAGIQMHREQAASLPCCGRRRVEGEKAYTTPSVADSDSSLTEGA